MDRGSKLVLLVWACAALATQAVIGRAWAGMPEAALSIFLVTAALVAVDRRFVALVLGLAYPFPALVRLVFETWDLQFYPLWMAAVLGVVMPDGLRTGWHIPARWRGPLVCGALAVAIATPLVVLREIDFNRALLGPMPHAVLSGLPVHTAAWTVHVGLVLVLGVLWFDWLLGARSLDMRSWILAPLGVGLVALVSAATYQLFGDMRFLNETLYGAIGRASGTVYDANVSGLLAAMGLAGAFAAARQARGWHAAVAGAFIVGLWTAVYASGSRTAFATAVVVTVAAGLSAGTRVMLAPRAWLLAAGVVVLLLVLATSGSNAVGPLGRVWETLPGASPASVGAFVAEMWNRNGYGVAATELIGRFPLTGIGIGGFHVFGPQLTHTVLPPDNAQNWYRHQLVELGLLGSIGWLTFAGLLAWAVVRPPRGLPATAWIVRGLLFGVGAVSLLGIPTQDVLAAVTFWTAVAWYVSIGGVTLNPAPLGRRAWVAMAALLLAFGVETARAATTTLRVPVRARAIGWPYSYGFYWPEPDGSGGEHRWARGRATALVDAPARFMSISVRVNHGDVSERPVAAKVWSEGRLVLDTRLASTDPVRVMVRVPDGLRKILIDTWASRVVNPRALGVDDDRELGLLVGWTFSDTPSVH
jgi:hypothetical protein